MNDDIDIFVSGLHRAFPGKDGNAEVIADVSFNVRRSETVCIVGPSGCGKTTILRGIAGLDKATQSFVKIDKERENRMTLLHQSPVLLPWRTVLQNACLGAELREDFDRVTRERVIRNLDAFGLRKHLSKLPSQLSGGQSQRLAIVRAFEASPTILLCDEPFSAIDFVARFTLNSEFKKLCQAGEGITCVFVTHNIEEAIFLGDRIVVLSSQPTRVVNIHEPRLSIRPFDAVGCRKSPEFEPLFNKIWTELKN